MQNVSVIVPIKNSIEYLSPFLNSINEVDIEDISLSVIFVISCISKDEVEKIIESKNLKPEIEIKIIETKEDIQAGEQRNIGVSNSNSDYLVFTDIDCTFSKDWLKKITAPLFNSNTALTGGGDCLHPDATGIEKNMNYIMTSFLTTGGMRGSCKKIITEFYPRSFNMAVTKECFLKTGGFINKFYGEDILFSMRIKDMGGTIQKVENAEVFHRRKRSILKFLKQQFLIGSARSELVKYKKSAISFVTLLPSLNILCFIFSIFGVFYFKQIKFLGYFYFLFLSLYSIATIIDFWIKEKQFNLFIPILILLQQLMYGSGLFFGFYKLLLKKVNYEKTRA